MRRLVALGQHRDVRLDAERVVMLPDQTVHVADSCAIASLRVPLQRNGIAWPSGLTSQPDLGFRSVSRSKYCVKPQSALQ
jgi:hypothetical protein